MDALALWQRRRLAIAAIAARKWTEGFRLDGRAKSAKFRADGLGAHILLLPRLDLIRIKRP